MIAPSCLTELTCSRPASTLRTEKGGVGPNWQGLDADRRPSSAAAPPAPTEDRVRGERPPFRAPPVENLSEGPEDENRLLPWTPAGQTRAVSRCNCLSTPPAAPGAGNRFQLQAAGSAVPTGCGRAVGHGVVWSGVDAMPEPPSTWPSGNAGVERVFGQIHDPPQRRVPSTLERFFLVITALPRQ